jgi:hypothetical protein
MTGRARFRSGVIGLTLALAAVIVVASASRGSTAAAQQVNSFTAVNSASSETGSQARGGFITLYTAEPVTDEEATYPYPWPQQTPGGLYVQTDSCQDENDYRKLPVLYVGRSGGWSQLNVYLANVDDTEETNGPCDASGHDRFTLHPKPGFGPDITRLSGDDRREAELPHPVHHRRRDPRLPQRGVRLQRGGRHRVLPGTGNG